MSNIFNIFSKKNLPSFAEIVTPYKDYLFAMAYRYTGNQPDAEDLLQELLIDLFNKQQQLRQADNTKAWLSKCLYHKFIDLYRKKQRIDAHEYTNNEIVLLAEHKPATEEEIYHQQVIDLLTHLSSAQRAVLCLHDIEGHKLTDLSTILDKPLGSLKSDLHRAREKIKKRLNVQPSDVTSRPIQQGGK